MSSFSHTLNITLPYTKSNLALAERLGKAIDPDVGGDKMFVRDIIDAGDTEAKIPIPPTYADTISASMPCTEKQWLEAEILMKNLDTLNSNIDEILVKRFNVKDITDKTAITALLSARAPIADVNESAKKDQLLAEYMQRKNEVASIKLPAVKI